jgi:GntR family transcriptional repressor for pyruvate dehydrogenase complex
VDLAPVIRRSAVQAVFDQLHAQILQGDLSPGDALPPERTLTATFAVNRQAVREALSRLAQIGLIEVRHGGATTVRDFRQSGGLDLLPHLVVRADGSLDLTVVRSIMEMRAAIGPDVARLAAERALPAHVAELAQISRAVEAADTLDALAAHDVRFWDVLTTAADNLAYQLALNSLRAFYRPVDRAIHEVMRAELEDAAGHTAVAAAVARCDAPEAEAAARRLLATGTLAMTEAFER